MVEIVFPAFFVISGVTGYAAVQHLGLGVSKPYSRPHLLLCAMSLFLSAGVIFQAMTVHAASIAEFVPALKWNIAAMLAGSALLPWFVALDAGRRPGAFLALLSAAYAVLLLANLLLPYGLQFAGIDSLYALRLPWGEVVTRARGHAGWWVPATSTALVAGLGYVLVSVVATYRQRRNAEAAWMLAAVIVFLMAATQGVLARLAFFDFIELGPVGFSAMLIVIGAVAARQSKERLRLSEARFHALFENTPQAILAIDPVTERVVEANEAALAALGYGKAELFARRLGELTRPEDRGEIRRLIGQFAGGEDQSPRESMRLDAWCVRKDGTQRYMDCQFSTLRDQQGKVLKLIVTAADITERRRAEEALRESETRLRAVIGQSPIGIAFAADGVTMDVNDVYLQTFGFQDVGQVRGRSLLEQIAPQCRAEAERRVRRRIAGEAVENVYETMGLRSDGTQFPLFISAKRLELRDGPVTIAFLIDISRQKESEVEIRRLAFYDQLTDLANRQLLNDRLRQALASCARTGRHCALLLIDLDRFKTVNDTLGHTAGDSLLRAVAARLAALTQSGASVARLGGDEFAVLLDDLSPRQAEAAAQAESLGERIRQALGEPHEIGPSALRCSCSIGVTVSRDHHLNAEDLIRQAGIAMSEAKNHGRNLLRFFDPRMQELINARVLLESDLHLAIEKREFTLHFQIQVDSSFLPVGAEALIRWNHPQRGTVAPGEFIALAEETGLIVPIGRWVLDAACAQIAGWRHNPLVRDLPLAINVSSKQFRRADFVDDVRVALRRHRIEPSQLKFELTESMVIEDIEHVIATMNALRALGVKFSLDDFGTGYSSLQYLKRLPLDQLKIDQSFVRDIAVDPNDHAIVRTVIAVARSLNLDVIAEGVETEEQRRLLLDCGCTHFQGYLFGRPAPPEVLANLVEANLIGLHEPAAEPEPARGRRAAPALSSRGKGR